MQAIGFNKISAPECNWHCKECGCFSDRWLLIQISPHPGGSDEIYAEKISIKMKNGELVKEINKNLAIALPDGISVDELQIQLGAFINQLIQTDFQKLISLLYRIDVSEPKLKQLLHQHPQEDAGKIIAALIIERQVQKIKTRQQFRRRDDNFTGEEKW